MTSTENTTKYKYQNDSWTLDDHLGIGKTGDLLAKMSLEVEPPFAIRLTGKWGSGKTSILRRAFATLGGNPIKQSIPLGSDKTEFDEEKWKNVQIDLKKRWEEQATARRMELQWPKEYYDIVGRSLCIWYSPWQHQNAENPLIPLLKEIQDQYMSRFSRINENKRSALLATAKLIESLIDGALTLSSAVSPKGPRAVKAFQGTTEGIIDSWEKGKNPLTKVSDGQRFHLLFEDVVEKALESLPKKRGRNKEDDRLIIFIDDLDRCEESVIVNLLESIKLYLNTKRCVFVLGIDDSAVLGALERYWTDRGEDCNREYLEKLFQATVSIPKPKFTMVRSFIDEQLLLHKITTKEQADPDSTEETEQTNEDNPDTEITEKDTIAKMVVKLVESNPRKIKNFLNSFCASWNLLGFDQLNKNETYFKKTQKLVLFTYLKLYHPHVWKILERQPNALPVFKLIMENNKSEDLRIPELRMEDQRILKEFFFKSFNHVLPDPNQEETFGNNTDNDKHGSLSLEKAVELFEKRLDRKRSDENFLKYTKALFEEKEGIDLCFLSL